MALWCSPNGGGGGTMWPRTLVWIPQSRFSCHSGGEGTGTGNSHCPVVLDNREKARTKARKVVLGVSEDDIGERFREPSWGSVCALPLCRESSTRASLWRQAPCGGGGNSAPKKSVPTSEGHRPSRRTRLAAELFSVLECFSTFFLM